MKFFSKKRAMEEMNITIAIEKLKFLAECFIKGEAKPTDLVHWYDNLDILKSSTIDKKYIISIQESYELLFQLFLEKYHPGLRE